VPKDAFLINGTFSLVCFKAHSF